MSDYEWNMDEIVIVKKELKKWEGEFYKENNRKPNKDDIGNAPEDVREAYTRYGILRKKSQKAGTTSLTHGKENVNKNNVEEPQASSENVWGSHLNKSISNNQDANWVSNDNDEEKTIGNSEENSSVEPSFTETLRQKLLAKAISTSDKKISLSQSSPSFRTGRSKSIFSANRISSPANISNSQPARSESSNKWSQKIGCDSDEDKDEVEIKSSIFAKAWKVTKKNASNKSLLESEMGEENKMSNFVSVLQQCKSSNNAAKLQNKYGANFKTLQQAKSAENIDKTSAVLNVSKDNDIVENTEGEANCDINEEEIGENESRPFGIFANSKNDSFDKDKDKDNDVSSENQKSMNANRTNSAFHDGDDDFFSNINMDTTSCVQQNIKNSSTSSSVSHVFTDMGVPDIINDSSNNKQVFNSSKIAGFSSMAVKGKQGRKRKMSVSDDKDCLTPVKAPAAKKRNVLPTFKSPEPPLNEDSNSMQIEVSWRPSSSQDKLMIDLDGSLQERPTSDEGEMQSDQEQSENQPKIKPKRSTNTASKMSSENYLRLNMKAKRYQRKGKFMSGPAHKRQQWKNKMKARSESFGSGKCFKCGQEGHWANKCKGMAKANSSNDSSKVLENIVDDTDFPTITEAFGMAQGIKIKPNPAKSKQPKAKKTSDPTVKEINAEDSEDSEEEPDVIRTAYEPTPAPPAMEPLYQAADEGVLMEPNEEVYKALEIFGFQSFRPGQKKAIMRVLCGQSTLVVLSTGAGKSLCYQLPAYMFAQRSPSMALVISPLVSLMEDQVSRLPPGVNGACLHTNMTPAQKQKVTEAVAAGEVHFLLISPEAMTGGKTGGSLPGISKMPPISFACIDEAHCLSEWSHHFRPSYLRICKILKEKFGVKCILGLTATATMVTAHSVAQHLGIENYQDATIRGSPVPTNLYLSVSRDEDKDGALITLLQGERFSKCDSIIIYCTRREQTDRIATLIRTCMQEMKRDRGPQLDKDSQENLQGSDGKKPKAKKTPKPKKNLDAECYHAGMSAAQRKRIQNAFMCGRLWVVVATVAFGMGLDKPDVRAVIHYNLPKSFESYVQEIGRAGRDGSPAQCHMFLDPREQDMNELKKHIYSNTVDRYIIKRFVRRVFPPCKCKDLHQRKNPADEGYTDNEECPPKRICPGHERAISIEGVVNSLDMKEEGISTLLCYLELHDNRWIEVFQNVYGTCMIQCYGGPMQLQQLAKKCPPVAVAIAKEKKLGISHSKSSKLEFPVVEISDSMGWESGPVKRELKLLQWNFDPLGMRGPSKTGVMVELSDLCFHMRSPGDLTDEELDDIVCFLADRMETQEATELFQLQDFYDTLHKVSHKDVWMCSVKVDEDRSKKLKSNILQYFDKQPEIDQNKITKLSFAREISIKDNPLISEKITCDNIDFVRSDIRAFIQLYSTEHQLSGRSVARVFYGIPSPCFPAEVWGRVRRFWRCHMDVDFNSLRKIATQELVKMR